MTNRRRAIASTAPRVRTFPAVRSSSGTPTTSPTGSPPDGRDGWPGRGRPLPAGRGAGLPVGEPGDHRAAAARPRGRASRWASAARPTTSAAGPSTSIPGGVDPVLGIERLQEAYFARFPDYPRGITVPGDRRRPDRPGRHQRLPADHPRPVHRSGRHSTATARPTCTRSRCATRSTRSPHRVFTEVNNGVYRCGFAGSQEAYDKAYDRLFTALDWLERAAGRPALPGGRHHHRGRRPAVHHAGPVRRGLPRPLQVQPREADRDAGAVGLRARPVPDAGLRRHDRLRRRSSSTTTSCTPTSTRRRSSRRARTWPNWLTPHGREALGGRPFGDGTPPGPPIAVRGGADRSRTLGRGAVERRFQLTCHSVGDRASRSESRPLG